MDYWPADDRDRPEAAQKEVDERARRSEIVRSYPQLEHGSLNSVTLCETGDRFQWTSVVNQFRERKLTLKRAPMKIFLETRPPPFQLPHTNIAHRAEHGANFIRTYVPEVDFSSELIRNEIATDAEITRKLDNFDPSMGNLLALVRSGNLPKMQLELIAFPTGETNRSLNVSSVRVGQSENAVSPTTVANRTFDTPIHQIVSSHSLVKEEQYFHLTVRTLASTSILEMKERHDETTTEVSTALHIHQIAQIRHPEVGHRPLVDVSSHSADRGVLLVNDSGAVYRWLVGGGERLLPLLYTSTQDTRMLFNSSFWRLAPAQHVDGCILTSDLEARCLDFRAAAGYSSLFSVRKPGELITSIERSEADNLVRLVSTSELLWIDDRFTRRPLLGYKHIRQFDRTLQTFTPPSQALTFLTSRKNSLVTVYDISRSDDRLLRSNLAPYSISPILSCDQPHAGFIFLKHPVVSNDVDISVFQLSNRGSLHRGDFGVVSSNRTGQSSPSYKWSEDVTALNMKVDRLHPDFGALGASDAVQRDLHAAYNEIFHRNAEEAVSLARNADNFHQILENMSRFWQDISPPVEHMLTTFDIAFRLGEAPNHFSRANFLTGSMLDPTKGYRALSQGRLVTEGLLYRSPWRYNINPSLNKVGIPSLYDPQSFANSLRAFELIPRLDQSGPSRERKVDAIELLTFDLALSMDIFSPQPFLQRGSSSNDELETMSLATEAMSLADEPSPVQFGYFRTVPTGTNNYYRAINEPSEKPSLDDTKSLLGVRLLLKEWEIGNDPDTYVYKDPYSTCVSTQDPTAIDRSRKAPAVQINSMPLTQSQRPPLVVTSKQTEPSIDSPPRQSLSFQPQRSMTGALMQTFGAGNRPTIMDPGIDAPQNFISNTQILPGPYGGRQPLAKRKPAKKRLGGF